MNNDSNSKTAQIIVTQKKKINLKTVNKKVFTFLRNIALWGMVHTMQD